MKIVIVPAGKTDAEELAVLSIKARKLMYKLSPRGFGAALNGPDDPAEEKRRIIKDLKDGNQLTLVARTQARGLAGFITGCVEKYSDDLLTAPFVSLVYIYVDAKYRRRGVARSLMRRLEAWAATKKIRTMELTVWSGNEQGQALFRDSGYVPLQLRLAKKLPAGR
jgi:ribosomal protein S18 acetylase RimI-like enzyme